MKTYLGIVIISILLFSCQVQNRINPSFGGAFENPTIKPDEFAQTESVSTTEIGKSSAFVQSSDSVSQPAGRSKVALQKTKEAPIFTNFKKSNQNLKNKLTFKPNKIQEDDLVGTWVLLLLFVFVILFGLKYAIGLTYLQMLWILLIVIAFVALLVLVGVLLDNSL